MSITAQIIADSISPTGDRLTTYILEYPRFVHAELMTHRMFSKNAASSRAIPIEKMIEAVKTNPATPVWWGKNQSGMQAKEELDNIIKSILLESYSGPYGRYLVDTRVTPMEYAKGMWLEARDDAVKHVRSLNFVGLHKQIANRLLEPWFNIRIILSGTEFTNFFALRAHPDAQPEIQELAYKMLDAYNASEPKSLNVGEWHIPFGDQMDEERLWAIQPRNPRGFAFAPDTSDEYIRSVLLEHQKIKVAIARCARISYLNYEGKDDYVADIKLCDRLFGSVPRHLSPTEHVAQCTGERAFIGNFRGWKQYRYTFEDQNLEDPRVVRKVWKGATTS